MDEVGFSRGSRLPIVMLERIVVGFLDNGQIVLRTALLHALHQVAELGERKGCRRDLLSQARHDGLYPPEKRAPQKTAGTLPRLYLPIWSCLAWSPPGTQSSPGAYSNSSRTFRLE